MKDLNLLPQKYVSMNKAREQLLIAAALALTAIAIIMVLYSTMVIYHNHLKSDNDSVLEDIQRYSVVNDVIQQNTTLKSEINTKEQFLNKVVSKISAYDYMGYIAGCIPKGSNVKLSSLKYDTDSIVVSFKIKDYDSLSSYVKRIRNTGLFIEVKIQNATMEDKGQIAAAVLCSINSIVTSK